MYKKTPPLSDSLVAASKIFNLDIRFVVCEHKKWQFQILFNRYRLTHSMEVPN